MSKNKLNRREFLRTAGLTLGGAVLASCTPKATSTPVPTSVPAATSTVAPVATKGYQGTFVIMSQQGNAETIQPWIDDRAAAFPGVKFDYRMLTNQKYAELFTAAEVAGDQIDFMELNGQDLRRYATGGKMLDLSGITYKDRFRPIGLETYTINGKLWALPVGGITGFPFFYNKKLLDQIGYNKEPETFDDLKQLVPELKKIDAAVIVHEGKLIYVWPVWYMWAYAQTSGNKPVENTIKTLIGDMKFTDPEHVAALEVLYRFAQDGLFIDGVNGLEMDATWLDFNQGKALIWFDWSGRIFEYRKGTYPLLDMSLMPPVRVVSDASIKRQLPGGTGQAYGIYSKIAPERLDLAYQVLDWSSSDKSVKFWNEHDGDPVSCNVNVEASSDPLCLKYAKECSANQFTYLDWLYPPEVTTAFQQNIQAVIAGVTKPDAAAAAIQAVLDDLVKNGYKFVS